MKKGWLEAYGSQSTAEKGTGNDLIAQKFADEKALEVVLLEVETAMQELARK